MKKQFNRLAIILVLAVAGLPVSAQTDSAWYCQPCQGDCDTIACAAAGTCVHCGMALVKQPKKKFNKTTPTKKMNILFYLQEGVEVLDFAGPMEVFANAGFTVSIVSKTKSPVTSQGILKIIPDYSIDDAPAADILAFFGGNSGNASNDPMVINWIKTQPAPAYYFSVCSGAFILGKAGLLDHLTATTFHASIESLKKACPRTTVLSNVRFVDNGHIITTAGVSAGIDGALHLVAKIKGEKMASQVAAYMEYDKWVPGQGLVVQNP